MQHGIISMSVMLIVSAAFVTTTGMLALASPTEEESSLVPREYLHEKCQEPDCDFVLLDTIIDCESGWQMVKNRQSSAFGYSQILDSTEATTPQYKGGLRNTIRM